MAKSTLPQKRDGEDGMVSPKTKAQRKEEAILKAREWALKRKGGSESSSSPKKKVAKSKEEEESDDVITNLPNIPAKKSRRSGAAASDDVSDTESIGSRTRSRRRSVGGAKAATTTATTTSTDFKSPPKGTRGRGRPRKTPKKVEAVAAEEQAVEEEKPTEQTPVAEEEKKEAAAPEVEPEAAEAKVEEEANEAPKISFLPHCAVFLHSVIIQWSIAFAVIMTFCLDWWLFQFGSSNDEVLSSQRASSSMLGMWLVTIAGYSIAFGTFSQVGWILTTSSLAMLSFAAKMYDEEMASASLPVYHVNDYGITIPDLLLCISFVACLFVMKQPPPVDVAAPSESTAAAVSSEEEGNSDESKEVMEAVMIASKEATGPRSLIGQRVSVEDNGFPSFGTVAGYDDETHFWTILFDDENREEGKLNRLELGSAFKSYSKELADSLKAMWKSGEI